MFTVSTGLDEHSLKHVKVISAAAIIAIWAPFVSAQDGSAPADPAAWGSDHVGRRIPMYMTGDECLFCHRTDVGVAWQDERHNASMRPVESVSPLVRRLLVSEELRALSGEATFVLGGARQRRLLKPNGKYGQFAMHAVQWTPPEDAEGDGTLRGADGDWDAEVFANRCAGCHATAVETEWNGFSAVSLDCFVCHGDTPPGHQNDPKLALFAKKRVPEPLVEMSTCGQCHLRGGKSTSSGLPYPNQFVPGDNLFRDFEVDLSAEYMASMNPGDRHVYQNVREVLVEGRLEMTCTTCHSVHGRSTRKHRVLKRLERGAYCAICHDDLTDYAQLLRYEMHSDVCEY